jgi:hypothetical protein
VAHRNRSYPVAFDLLDQHGALVARTFLPHRFVPGAAVELAVNDPGGRPVLSLFRPPPTGEAAVYVRDPQRRDVGRVVRTAPRYPEADISGTFDGLGGSVGTFASERADLVPVLDLRGELVATLSQGGTGLAAVAAESDWILQRHEPTAEPLLSLLAAAPIAFDLLFEPQVVGR